jgi:hypothetical protein
MYATSFKGCSYIEEFNMMGPWYGSSAYYGNISIGELIAGSVEFKYHYEDHTYKSFTGKIARSSGYL